MGEGVNVSISLGLWIKGITYLKMGIHRCSRCAALRALFNTKPGAEASV
jgi:hypothetical protein